MKKVAFLLFSLVFFPVVAQAQSSIKAEVDKKSITTDEAVVYKITVISDSSDQPQIELPKLQGAEVVSSAESSTVSYVDKALKTHFLYVLVLAPRAAGAIKIPPAHLKTKAGSIATDSFEIEVKPGKKPILPQDQPQVTL